ncbi:MAG: hypothetical protein EOO61_01440 [Hymenobacter sp.]|nr:MAG: hypothetical protein EOO61_01440 [Hymenobacter sp.]
MKPVQLSDATRSLGAPPDWKNENGPCETLDIFDNETPEGNFMISAWQPGPDELMQLNAGGLVYMHIRGANHPVVALTVS